MPSDPDQQNSQDDSFSLSVHTPKGGIEDNGALLTKIRRAIPILRGKQPASAPCPPLDGDATEDPIDDGLGYGADDVVRYPIALPELGITTTLGIGEWMFDTEIQLSENFINPSTQKIMQTESYINLNKKSSSFQQVGKALVKKFEFLGNSQPEADLKEPSYDQEQYAIFNKAKEELYKDLKVETINDNVKISNPNAELVCIEKIKDQNKISVKGNMNHIDLMLNATLETKKVLGSSYKKYIIYVNTDYLDNANYKKSLMELYGKSKVSGLQPEFKQDKASTNPEQNTRLEAFQEEVSNKSKYEINPGLRKKIKEENSGAVDPKEEIEPLLREGKNNIFNAIECGDINQIKELINTGFDVNQQNESQQTPLMIAAQHGNNEAVKLLIQAKANIHDRNRTGDTALFFAVEKGDIETINTLIEAGSKVNCQDNDGFSPLTLAIQRNNIQVVELLIKLDADVNFKVGRYEETPLMKAVRYGNKDLVEKLIAAGAETAAACPNSGHTALSIAQYYGYEEIVSFLLSLEEVTPIPNITPTNRSNRRL